MRRLFLGFFLAATLGVVFGGFWGGPVLGQEPSKTDPVVAKAADAVPTPVAERLQSVLGIVAHPGPRLCVVRATERRSRSASCSGAWLLQWIFALVVLRWEPGRDALKFAGELIQAVLNCALAGETMVFGEKLVDPTGKGPIGFVFAFIGSCRR